MKETLAVKVVASTPGADTDTYNLFSSVVSFHGGGLLRSKDVSRVTFSVENDQTGTLKFYRSTNKGTTWDQVGGDIAVVAAAATDINGPYDFLCDTYQDVKLDWVNGGSAQGTWRPEVTLIVGDRSPGDS